jgi:glutathione synthase/RimK-type ligase-like ATP-grasp enzyme
MNYLFLRTPLGRKYTIKIADEIRTLKNRGYVYRCGSLDLALSRHPEWDSKNLIIHSRAAHPDAPWMNKLKELEQKGFRVINKTSVLELTSDKFESVEFLQDKFELPRTFLLAKGNILSTDNVNKIRTEEVVVKPRYSQGGGEFVSKISKEKLRDREFLTNITGKFSCSAVVQEVIPYLGIARIFCIGGKSLPVYTWDAPNPTRWKVSVCLNQKQVTSFPSYVNKDIIIMYAEEIQKAIGGEINFIDVFWTENGPVLSEINTACSLLTHERITGFNISKSIAEYLNSQKK